jgi:uncharacterized protein with FMN-binding domain
MPRSRSNSTFNFSRGIRKFFLSAFVVFAFIVYAVHERLTSSSAAPASASAAPASGSGQEASNPSGASSAQQAPASNSSSSSSAAYKDGVYTGPPIDVNYGLVEVQATVQHGRLASVQFLQYPNDRRTSVQINSIAIPYLQQEALQAQSANVDIISGATLTSEGFQMSLQSALSNAH